MKGRMTMTPMLVQYLVGLCCLRRNPDAVEIVIGDMVLDPAAGKNRDVDVTVTLENEDGSVQAFKAYEVKREGSPLDVSKVEQLCMKLLDMPTVTHRAIVSSSGFTDGARVKAERHGIELYAIRPWTRPMEEQFPGFGMTGSPEYCLRFKQSLLYWINQTMTLRVPTGPSSCKVEGTDLIYDECGNPHQEYSSFEEYQHALLLRSTEILWELEPATTVQRIYPPEILEANPLLAIRPAWPHTHSLEVGGDEVYLKLSDSYCKIECVTINGSLQWQTHLEKPNYHVLERVPDGAAFAGAMVALGPSEDQMFGFVVSPKSKVAGVHPIRLAKKHLNVIRKLRLEMPDPQPKEPYRDRDAPHRAPLPHHAAYGSVLRDSADQAESDPGEHKSK